MKKSLRGNLQAFLPRVHLLRCRNIKWAKGECVLNQIVFAAGVLLFPAVCTTLGAAGVFLLRRSAAPRTQRVLSGMAAGIMLAASVWSLLLPAIERTRELGVAAWVPPSAGLVLAASGLVEPLGALAAFALAGWVQAALPWLMSAAAGCMVCVTAQEMIPEAVEQDEPAGVVSIVLGFALMMALDVAL